MRKGTRHSRPRQERLFGSQSFSGHFQREKRHSKGGSGRTCLGLVCVRRLSPLLIVLTRGQRLAPLFSFIRSTGLLVSIIGIPAESTSISTITRTVEIILSACWSAGIYTELAAIRNCENDCNGLDRLNLLMLETTPPKIQAGRQSLQRLQVQSRIGWVGGRNRREGCGVTAEVLVGYLHWGEGHRHRRSALWKQNCA